MKTINTISPSGEIGDTRISVMELETKEEVGWLEVSELVNGDVEIDYFLVHEKFRGSGIGRVLIDTVRESFPERNLVAFIEPHPQSPLTKEQEKEWFVRMGFEEIPYSFGSYKKFVMFLSRDKLK